LVVASELVVVLEGGRSPELERTISEAVDALIVVDDIEGGRDEIQGPDEEVVVDGLLSLSVDAPQNSNHPMEVELPCPCEGNSDVKQVSSAQVQLV
jgi:hypothetical protein